MRLTFLGTGTSFGVPLIGCTCPVCTSPDPRNRRTRSGLWITAAGQSLLADLPPDFRAQALRERIGRVDAVFLTHGHADHLFGLDDLRRYNELQRAPIPVHAAPDTLAIVRRAFAYAFEPAPPGLTRPRLDLRTLDTAPVDAGGVTVTPLRVRHGADWILGFRFDADGRSAAYVPDCNELPEATLAQVRGVDCMILDALRHEPHPTHFSVSESVACLRRIGARRSYLTHLCHRLDHAATEADLPPDIRVACDGLTVEW